MPPNAESTNHRLGFVSWPGSWPGDTKWSRIGRRLKEKRRKFKGKNNAICIIPMRYYCRLVLLFLIAFTHLYKRVCPSVRPAFLLNEPIMGKNGRKWRRKQSKYSKHVKMSSELSQEVPKCPKTSQNVPKCPLQTHRYPNGLVTLHYNIRDVSPNFHKVETASPTKEESVTNFLSDLYFFLMNVSLSELFGRFAFLKRVEYSSPGWDLDRMSMPLSNPGMTSWSCNQMQIIKMWLQRGLSCHN